MDSVVNYATNGVNQILVKIYEMEEADKENKKLGFIKFSLPDDYDPEGYVKVEVGLPNIEMMMIGEKKHGYEIVAVWESEIESGRTWYTDSNGLELIERNWVKGQQNQDIPANYYPITSMIGVKDNNAAMFVLNDRAQGGTSSKPGRVELNIVRKTVGADMGGMVQGPDFKGELYVEFFMHFEWRKPG